MIQWEEDRSLRLPPSSANDSGDVFDGDGDRSGDDESTDASSGSGRENDGDSEGVALNNLDSSSAIILVQDAMLDGGSGL